MPISAGPSPATVHGGAGAGGLVHPIARSQLAPPLAPRSQVLFGSFPIAHCRDPYAVVRYFAERAWPRVHDALRLAPPAATDTGADARGTGREPRGGAGGSVGGFQWSPLSLCEALAAKHNWRSRRGGRADVYRAANTLLRGALAGRPGMVLAFLPPTGGNDCGGGGGGSGGA